MLSTNLFVDICIQTLEDRCTSTSFSADWAREFSTWKDWLQHNFGNENSSDDDESDCDCDCDLHYDDDESEVEFGLEFTPDDAVQLIYEHVSLVCTDGCEAIPPSSHNFVEFILRPLVESRIKRQLERERRQRQLDRWERAMPVIMRWGDNRNGYVRIEEWGRWFGLIQMGILEWKWGCRWGGLVRDSVVDWSRRWESGVDLIGCLPKDVRDGLMIVSEPGDWNLHNTSGSRGDTSFSKALGLPRRVVSTCVTFCQQATIPNTLSRVRLMSASAMSAIADVRDAIADAIAKSRLLQLQRVASIHDSGVFKSGKPDGSRISYKAWLLHHIPRNKLRASAK